MLSQITLWRSALLSAITDEDRKSREFWQSLSRIRDRARADFFLFLFSFLESTSIRGSDKSRLGSRLETLATPCSQSQRAKDDSAPAALAEGRLKTLSSPRKFVSQNRRKRWTHDRSSLPGAHRCSSKTTPAFARFTARRDQLCFSPRTIAPRDLLRRLWTTPPRRTPCRSKSRCVAWLPGYLVFHFFPPLFFGSLHTDNAARKRLFDGLSWAVYQEDGLLLCSIADEKGENV